MDSMSETPAIVERAGAESRHSAARDRPWRTACVGPPAPVPPVLSGRDQASATPSIAILHPLPGSNGCECIMRLW